MRKHKFSIASDLKSNSMRKFDVKLLLTWYNARFRRKSGGKAMIQIELK